MSEGSRNTEDMRVKYDKGMRFERWLQKYFSDHGLIMKQNESFPFLPYEAVKNVQQHQKVNFDIMGFDGVMLAHGSATWRIHVGKDDFFYRSWYFDRHPEDTVFFLGLGGEPDDPEKVLIGNKRNMKPIRTVMQKMVGDNFPYKVYIFALADMRPIYPANLLTVSLADAMKNGGWGF